MVLWKLPVRPLPADATLLQFVQTRFGAAPICAHSDRGALEVELALAQAYRLSLPEQTEGTPDPQSAEQVLPST